MWPAQLDNLLHKGWIEELQQQPSGQSKRKRYFSISRQGRQILARETRKMSALVALAQSRNPLPEAENP